MNRRSAALFASMCLIWGIPYLLIRVAVRDFAPGTLAFLRTAIGGLALLPFAPHAGGFAPVRRPGRPPLAFPTPPSALPRFLPVPASTPAVLQSVRHTASPSRRSLSPGPAPPSRVADPSGTGGAAPSPSRLAEATEERAQLLRAVNSLRQEDRLVVACRYFLELSSEETADVLGWPQGTVKSRLSRALDRLREQLGERDA